MRFLYRHLWRHRFISLANVAALATGLLACLLAATLARHELAYDHFHEHADRLYRITRTYVSDSGTAKTTAQMPPNFADLPKRLPGVKQVVRFGGFSSIPVRAAGDGDRPAVHLDALAADEEVFEAFSFDLTRGNPETVLTRPSSIVLTQQTARRLFGARDPIGQTIVAGGQLSLTVTGLLEPVPEQSSIRFDGLLSFDTQYEAFGLGETEEQVRQGIAWHEAFHTYLLLRPGVRAETVEAQLAPYVASLTNIEDVRQSTFRLEPLADVYLHSRAAEHLGPTGNAWLIRAALAAALLVLLMALFNYAVLSTVQAARRTREVGVRKALGSHRIQLAGQFVAESCALCVAAFALAVLLAGALLPSFNAAVGHALSHDALLAPGLLAALLGGTLLAGVLAAAYPAFFLSRLDPAAALRGKAPQLPSAHAFRKGALGVQFFAAAVLLIVAVTAARQTAFIAEREAAMPSDRLLVLDVSVRARDAEVLRQSLARHPFVQHTALASGVPFAARGGTYSVEINGTERTVSAWSVDSNFVQALGLDVLASSTPDGTPSANEGVFVNETLVNLAGWQDPLGQKLNAQTVVGVVEDFHFESLRQRVSPLVLAPLDVSGEPSRFGAMVVLRLDPSAPVDILHAVEETWRRQLADLPFSYFYLGDKYDALHRDDRRFARLLLLVLGFALVIACTGLFAVAAYATEQRSKEIAIRKVLGASTADIAALFMKELAATIGVAVALALPVAYLISTRWLSGFAYHVSVGVLTPLLCSAVALTVAFAAMSYHVLRAAWADPVRSIRQE